MTYVDAIFKRASDIVKKVLQDFPETRGNDWELLFKVWEKQGVVFTPAQQMLLRRCIAPETITRARRQLQEMGLFLSTDGKQNQRSFLENEYREKFGND